MTVEEFRLPDVGEGVAEGELVSWLVAPGDRVEEDQPVAEVETDKALVEVPSSYDGVVEELFVEAGETVPVGDVIISFRVDEAGDDAAAADEASDDAPAEPTTEPPAETGGDEDAEPAVPGGRAFAPPSARRIARELGVDLAAVDGSGPGGRVTEGDVRTHAESGSDGSAEEPPEPTPTDLGLAERESAVDRRGETDAGGDSGLDAATETAAGAPDPAGRDTTLATPATRKAARELGVDIDDVPTDETRDGEAFVAEADVRAHADALSGVRDVEATVEEVSEDEVAETAEDVLGDTETVDETIRQAADAVNEADETVPYRGVRRTIGRQMERSKYTAPHVTHHDTAEVDALVEARERLKPKADARGVKLTYLPFVMKAVVAGLKEHPSLNSELREDDEEIVLKSEYNLGIAVATDAGLMVPVVDAVDEKGLFELAAEVADLAARARERTLGPEEMNGGTFTITNFGAVGGEYATPIINYPETAILGLGAIEERPVVRSHAESDSEFLGEADGSTVVPAPTLPLSLSIDHRVVDGAVAAEFANTVMKHVENPLLLLNE